MDRLGHLEDQTRSATVRRRPSADSILEMDVLNAVYFGRFLVCACIHTIGYPRPLAAGPADEALAQYK